MRRAIFVFFCLVLAVSMVAIPADTMSAKSASSLELSAPSPAQLEEEKEQVDDILAELKRARGLTDDKEIRGQIDDVRSMVIAAWKYEKAGDSELALAMKYRIAKHLEQLINQLPAASPGMTTAAAAIPEENPLYEELVRVRAKIDVLIDMELERVPEGVTPLIPEIQRVTEPEIKRPPEMERLIVYSAKFLCGPAFGGEGVQPGSYSTAINVHNPQDQTVYLFKKVVIAEPEYKPRGQISAFRKVRLAPDEAIEIDCLDIGSLLRPKPEPGRPSIIPVPPGEVEVTCPTECDCMTRENAYNRGYTSLCQQEPCDKDASGQLMYCFRKPTEEPEPSTIPLPPGEGEVKCPTECECMTRAEAEERGYTSWCQNETTPCGTDTAGIQKFCFEKPAGKSGLSRIASAMPEETGLTPGPEQTGTIVQTTAVSPVRSLIRFVKGFVVIYSTAPLDVVAVYTASTQFGFSLDVEYLQPSTRGVIPIRIPDEPEEEMCPQGCVCLNEDDAYKRYGPNATMCQDQPCGYDQYQNRMFCWKPVEQAVCPQGCVCLNEDDAYKRYGPNATMCQDQPCGYDQYQNPMFCFEEAKEPTPTETSCPYPCKCMTEAEAARYKLTGCQRTEMPCAWDTSQNPTKFCYQPPQEPEQPTPTEISCPRDCYCLTVNEGYGRGYERCQGTDIECAWDQNRNPIKFCFQEPEQPQPQPPPTQTQCPQDCFCMDPKRASAAGYEWCLRNNDEIPCGNGQYCFRKPIQQLTPPLQLR